VDPIEKEGHTKAPPIAQGGDKTALEQITLDELLAKSPKPPMKLTTFSFGGVDLTAELPENVRVDSKTTNYSVSTEIVFEPDTVVVLDLYVHDLPQTIQHWTRNPSSGYSVVKIWRGPEFQLVETNERGEKRFYVEMLPHAGPIGMRAYVKGDGNHFQSGLVTRAQAIQIFQSLRTLALKKPLGADSADQIETLGGELNRKGAGRVDSVKLEGYDKLCCTGFALPLLKGVPEVRSVHLHMFRARQNDFSALAELPNLQSLDLTITDVGDEGLLHIAKCRQLQFLTIGSGSVTLAGLKVLQELKNIKQIDLRLSGNLGDIQKIDLPILLTLPGLRSLELRDAKLTDKDLVPLGQIAELENLELCGNTEITDAGLVNLDGLSKLKSLDLSGTQVMDPAVAAFKQKKPGVRVKK